MARAPHQARRASRKLAVAAGTATAALVAAEGLHVWRKRRAPERPREALPGGGGTPRETVEALRAGYRAGTANETSVLVLFVSFGATFAVARAVTHSIRLGRGPLRDVRIARRHIHHFVPGILLVLISGGASITLRHEQLDHWLALPFGTGAALILDETALLIELSDVYWSEQGVLSIDVGLGAGAALATLATLVRMVRRGKRLTAA